MAKDIENRPWIHVGVTACPTCGAICTGHILSRGHVSRSDWQKASLDYFCSKCKKEFRLDGTKTKKWLAGVWEDA